MQFPALFQQIALNLMRVHKSLHGMLGNQCIRPDEPCSNYANVL